MPRLKLLLLLVVAAAAGFAYVSFDLGQYLNLHYLKAQQHAFEAYYHRNPLRTAAIYFGLYVLTALGVPGALLMTIAGGALFGLWLGAALVSFASSFGALLAFLVARYLLKDWVRSRFRKQFERIDQGIESRGKSYLFTLRIVPLFPFFVVNALMGVTRMRLWTYYWVTQTGMLPGTLVYANAGRHLAQLRSMHDILSPGIVASFVLLAAFPFIAQRITSLLGKSGGRPFR